MIAELRRTSQSSRWQEFFPDRRVRVHATGSDVGEPGVDLLPDIDAIHEIIPRGRRRKAAHQLDGRRLDTLVLRDR